MIIRGPLLDQFEKKQIQSSKADYFLNLKIFESLYIEAKHFGIFPLKNPLEGIENNIRLAKILNVRKNSPVVK
jgi:hypothetical protein